MQEYHEDNRTSSDEWYTPPEIFDALGQTFDLDPCHPSLQMAEHCCVPANFMSSNFGLDMGWGGRYVWMNPPFGRRNGVVPWLRKFIENDNGIGLCRAYTSAAWFQDYVSQMDLLFFPYGKTQFVRPDGSRGKSPGSGVVLFAKGSRGINALWRIRLPGLTCLPQTGPGYLPPEKP